MPLRAALLLTTVAVLFLTEASWGLTVYPFNLQTSSDLVTEGYLSLSWQPSTDSRKDQPIAMQLATEPNFQAAFATYNLAQQQQVSLSGLANGEYYARLIDSTETPISNVTSFHVQHRELTTAWLLFAVGALLFLLLTGILLLLQKSSSRNDKLGDSY